MNDIPSPHRDFKQSIPLNLVFREGKDTEHDRVSVALLDQVAERRAMQHVLEIEELVIPLELLLGHIVIQHVALQMNGYCVSGRRVVGDIEDVGLAVDERRLARLFVCQPFFFRLGIGDHVEVPGRNLPPEKVAIDPLGNPEIHAYPGLAGGVRPPRSVDVLLAKEAATARAGLDLMTMRREELGHLHHAELFADSLFGQFARLLDGNDLHRPRDVLVRSDIHERHPDAARGDAVAIK